MKKLLFLLTVLCVVIGAMAGCDKEEKKETTVRLGEVFTIKTNEIVKLTSINSDSLISIHFKQILNDERCPKSQCELCYGSRANIQISITENSKTSDIELSILGCIDEVPENGIAYKDTLGYRMRLLRLDPYSDAPINSSDYKAKLKITKL